ncbi:2-oxo-4-hydroxy-4-carboxy-5-ureidoimidazoline decarboxylase, partial [Ideonella sp.]|uniref:2-oxo-4-hydroxy-4-carboxy-5-ureidoimidazoline decarboxylase n=1 Tax=Ideonella sp. TaxID=1929293 RepID=UPI003BB75710
MPTSPPLLTLDQLNAADTTGLVALLDGTYEHSPWVAERAASARPFNSLAQLKHAMAQAVDTAGPAEQLALIRAHPELAGKAMVAQALTVESSHEQRRAGLTDCSPAEFAQLQQLNQDYNAKFGFPFILAVRGPRGLGLPRQAIIDTFARRLARHPDEERTECLRNIHRIAEIRLDDKFGSRPLLGEQIWDWAEALAEYSDEGYREQGQLSVAYLTPAHQACAARLVGWMRDAGFDEVQIDAVGNVVGVYLADPAAPAAPRLLTGSHYDTVRNGGKHDGRLGILLPMACVQTLHRAGRRLPFAIEVVGFAEEEGQRYPATFLASSALVGRFEPSWLAQTDADGVRMDAAMAAAGLPATMEAIAALARDPARYLGFVEVHIEQGPVLNQGGLPLGVVSSINGSRRFRGEVIGTASHAGTTPMALRRDAAVAVAELALMLAQRAASVPDLV